jgi:hypothetical protein
VEVFVSPKTCTNTLCAIPFFTFAGRRKRRSFLSNPRYQRFHLHLAHTCHGRKCRGVQVSASP